MSKYIDEAYKLRNDDLTHYNCSQAIVIPFCKDANISTNAGYMMASNFGKGMKKGITCGVITGALMALGLLGITSMEAINEFHITINEKYNGAINCKDLLNDVRNKGIPRKEHCDSMVYECVALVEKLTQKHKK